MTLPLSKEQIAAIQARAEKATRKTRSVRHTPFPAGWLREETEIASAEVGLDREITPSILSSLCQQALRAIELEAGVSAAEHEVDDHRCRANSFEQQNAALERELAATRKALEEERERSDSLANQLQDYREGKLP